MSAASKFVKGAALLGLVVTQAGCPFFWDQRWDDDWDGDWGPPGDEPVVQIELPSWPPIGPTGEVLVVAESPAGIDWATFRFGSDVSFAGNGQTRAVFRATGPELGEGMGRLTIEVQGRDGAGVRHFVEDLLVDLSPPKAYLGPTALPAKDATLDFWIGDAWIVAGAELLFAGKRIAHQLPEGYPATLGESWDYSLVQIPVEELPAVLGTAHLRVWDAAGNVSEEFFTLSIDGTPPEVDLLAPSAGAELEGAFVVEALVSDDRPGATLVEVEVGGVLLATGAGPHAAVTLHASELAPGPTRIDVIGIDAAGNRSLPRSVEVVIATPVED